MTIDITTGCRLVGVGVQDALTASLVARAEFDVAWVGSFEASTYRKLPDVNLVTSTEMADAVRAVRSGCRLPIMVDADNGYGSDEAAVRSLELFSAAGADAMCLEDNQFPKRNSLYSVKARQLEQPKVFADRIRRLAEYGSTMKIIARTEALVAGLGVDEAVGRMQTYADAGADLLFVQTNASYAELLPRVLDRIAGLLPIVLAPTALPDITATQFHDMGANVVLFANVVSRTAIRSITEMLADLRNGGRLAVVDRHMVDLQKMFDLTDAMRWNPS